MAGGFLIGTLNLIIGLTIIIIPFLLAIIFVKKAMEKNKDKATLEERVLILEAQMREVRSYINDLETM